ncbi:hypothetical protein [Cardinium endosymbiont of Encarsia pergandiella]|uniref:hypothetical protein n=1 Tax=Cardinium endosymbiont of Encarsia pergandiella TaxID=249402 RepID=UPI0004B01D7E|nr:hypothetical protein [Cardinium endosymbiont of Encarsia pergandiella]
MFYITVVATGCKRHPSNLTNINIVTEPTALQAEKVTAGETTSNALPSVKGLSGSLSQEEKKEEEEEEEEDNIQELVEAEQVLEAEINLLRQEVNEGSQNPSAPCQWWDEEIYSSNNQCFTSEYSQQPDSYNFSSTTFAPDSPPPPYESHQFGNVPTFGTSSNANIGLKPICNPNDLKDALKHPTCKYQYLTLCLAELRCLKPKKIFLLKINGKQLDFLEEKLKKSEHKKAILEQTKHAISLDQTFLFDTESVIKIISISIAIREYEIKYLKKVIQKKQKKQEKKAFDHTNEPNLSQGSCTNGTNLYPDLTQIT